MQSTCFLLREMGFSCLAPSVRDFGLSGASSHPDILTWGYDAWLKTLCAYSPDLLLESRLHGNGRGPQHCTATAGGNKRRCRNCRYGSRSHMLPLLSSSSSSSPSSSAAAAAASSSHHHCKSDSGQKHKDDSSH